MAQLWAGVLEMSLAFLAWLLDGHSGSKRHIPAVLAGRGSRAALLSGQNEVFLGSLWPELGRLVTST